MLSRPGGVVCTVYRTVDGGYTGFRLAGHAGGGPRGADPLCAGISTLAQALVIGLKDCLGLVLAIRQDSGGFLECRLPDGADARDGIRLLFETFIRTLQALEDGAAGTIRIEETVTAQEGVMGNGA
jgi:uncharacterized protein YsxB (DUF464 family)